MFAANATAQILDLARAGKVRILAVNAAERIKAARRSARRLRSLPGSMPRPRR
jgi:hypothetical protein